MKKKLTACWASLLVIILSGCNIMQKQPDPAAPPTPESSVQQAAEPHSPQAAVIALMDDLKDWGTGQLSDQVRLFTGKEYDLSPLENVAVPLLERVEMDVYHAKEDGANAQVDVAVTAVDAEKAFRAVSLQLLTKTVLSRKDSDSQGFDLETVAEFIEENIDISQLDRIKTNTTVYLVKGADDRWKLDLNQPDNIGFVNAVTGGAVDLLDEMQHFLTR